MQSSAPGRSPRPARARRAPAAFTLLELLIAIAIIGILASLILTVAGSANIKAKNAQVSVDIKDLEKGIAAFKQRFNGAEPPSRITLYEAHTGWAGDPRSMGLIRQIWPQFDFTIDRDINNNGTTTDTITLTGSECLVFFLGGIPDLAIAPGSPGFPGRAPLGFSQNPANPFAIGGSNREKFMEFNINRFTDVNGNGMMEYADTLPGQVQISAGQAAWPFWLPWASSTPYLYYSSYGGQGYDIANDVVGGALSSGKIGVSPYNATNPQPNPPGGTFIDVYRQAGQSFWATPIPTPPYTTPSSAHLGDFRVGHRREHDHIAIRAVEYQLLPDYFAGSRPQLWPGRRIRAG